MYSGTLRGRHGARCKFESKEACESLCFHSKSECTVHGVAKASDVRRCVRRGAGTGAARVWRATRLMLGIAFP